MIAKLPQHDVLYHSQKLTTAISRENLPLAQNAIDVETAGKDETTVVRELAQKKFSSMKGLEPAAAERRLIGFLARRGFSANVVYRVARELTANHVIARSDSDEAIS